MDNTYIETATEISDSADKVRERINGGLLFYSVFGKPMRIKEMQRLITEECNPFANWYWYDKATHRRVHIKAMTSEYLMKLFFWFLQYYSEDASVSSRIWSAKILGEIRRRVVTNKLIDYNDSNREMFPINNEYNQFSPEFHKEFLKMYRRAYKENKKKNEDKLIAKISNKDFRAKLLGTDSGTLSKMFDNNMVTFGVCPKCERLGAIFYKIKEVSKRGEHSHYVFFCRECKRHRNIKDGNPRLNAVIKNIENYINVDLTFWEKYGSLNTR